MNNDASRLRVLDLNELKKLRESISQDIPKLQALLVFIESEHGKEVIGRLKSHLEDIRDSYMSIDCTTHPNVVVAKLASMAGAEREVRDLLDMYENPIKRKKELDAQLAICDDVIRDKERDSIHARR